MPGGTTSLCHLMECDGCEARLPHFEAGRRDCVQMVRSQGCLVIAGSRSEAAAYLQTGLLRLDVSSPGFLRMEIAGLRCSCMSDGSSQGRREDRDPHRRLLLQVSAGAVPKSATALTELRGSLGPLVVVPATDAGSRFFRFVHACSNCRDSAGRLCLLLCRTFAAVTSASVILKGNNLLR